MEWNVLNTYRVIFKIYFLLKLAKKIRGSFFILKVLSCFFHCFLLWNHSSNLCNGHGISIIFFATASSPHYTVQNLIVLLNQMSMSLNSCRLHHSLKIQIDKNCFVICLRVYSLQSHTKNCSIHMELACMHCHGIACTISFDMKFNIS